MESKGEKDEKIHYRRRTGIRVSDWS
jgi:hypothetical protein